MKLHACRRCGARFRTHAELQQHLLTHPNVCVTCYRVFSRRVDLLAHKCKVEELLCKVCQRSYSTQTKLARHKRETSCGHSLPPEAKRQKLMPPIEDLDALWLVKANLNNNITTQISLILACGVVFDVICLSSRV